MRFHHSELFSTYSIVARHPDTGQFGVAVQTHQMCVGSVVPWLLPGRGAFATQSLANIRFGPMTLAMLQEGISARISSRPWWRPTRMPTAARSPWWTPAAGRRLDRRRVYRPGVASRGQGYSVPANDDARHRGDAMAVPMRRRQATWRSVCWRLWKPPREKAAISAASVRRAQGGAGRRQQAHLGSGL